MGKVISSKKNVRAKRAKIPTMPDWFVVAPGVWGLKDIFVNVYLVRNSVDNSWVLIDTGLFTTGKKIKTLARQIFWPEEKPSAIILTHGHFDHTGSVIELAEEWNIPVYAHR